MAHRAPASTCSADFEQQADEPTRVENRCESHRCEKTAATAVSPFLGRGAKQLAQVLQITTSGPSSKDRILRVRRITDFNTRLRGCDMDTTTVHSKDRTRACGRNVELLARAIVDAHSHFRHRAEQFEFHFEENVLIVRGVVPSFYLKQVLQSALRDLEGVLRVDNQVAVVSSEGLSSLGFDFCS